MFMAPDKRIRRVLSNTNYLSRQLQIYMWYFRAVYIHLSAVSESQQSLCLWAKLLSLWHHHSDGSPPCSCGFWRKGYGEQPMPFGWFRWRGFAAGPPGEGSHWASTPKWREGNNWNAPTQAFLMKYFLSPFIWHFKHERTLSVREFKDLLLFCQYI